MAIEGYNNQYRISDEAQDSILRNLRQNFPALSHIPDGKLLNTYDEFSMSNSNEKDFPQWFEE